MDIFATRRARLKAIIDELAGGNISVFAGRYDYSRAQISQYLSERYNDGRSIGERVARALEAKVGASAGWMDQPLNGPETLIGPTPDRESADVDFPMVLRPEDGPLLIRNIPVLGTLFPEGEGMIRIRQAENDIGKKFVEFHSRDKAAYALIVRGNGLRPRVKSGEHLIVEPSAEPLPGDDVLLKLISGEQMLMQLLYARDGEFTLGALNENGPTALVFDCDVVQMSLVSAIVRSSTLKLD